MGNVSKIIQKMNFKFKNIGIYINGNIICVKGKLPIGKEILFILFI